MELVRQVGRINILAREKPGFNMLKQFRGVKSDLKRITGSDATYYDCLFYNGYHKSSEIPTVGKSLQILDELRGVFNEALQEVQGR